MTWEGSILPSHIHAQDRPHHEEREGIPVNKTELWDKAVAFHGHVCGGLAIGYQAALYAAELLDLAFSDDEEVVCIAENDACGVDAVQVVLGCSVGKGNLLFRMRGKQAFSFYDRGTGKAVRLVLKPRPRRMTREEAFAYYRNSAPAELFDVREPAVALPEPAQIFRSWPCDRCGEETAEGWLRLSEGKRLCLDCYQKYDRFDV